MLLVGYLQCSVIAMQGPYAGEDTSITIFKIVNSNVMYCNIRGYEVVIRSDDCKRDIITVLKNSIYNVYRLD